MLGFVMMSLLQNYTHNQQPGKGTQGLANIGTCHDDTDSSRSENSTWDVRACVFRRNFGHPCCMVVSNSALQPHAADRTP